MNLGQRIVDARQVIGLTKGLGQDFVDVLSELAGSGAAVEFAVGTGRIAVPLAAAGVGLQGTFRNPLADPSLIGVTAGASLGASLAIVSGSGALAGYLGFTTVSLGAFLGGLLTVTLVYRLAQTANGTSVATMLLAGIAVTADLLGAPVGFGLYDYRLPLGVGANAQGKLAAGDLADLRGREIAMRMAVELAKAGERDMIEIEVQAHPNRVGGHQKVHVAILVERHLRVARARAERAEYHGRAAALWWAGWRIDPRRAIGGTFDCSPDQ